MAGHNFEQPVQAPMTAFLSVKNAAVSGLVAGSLQAVLFNPYDRALYLSITQERPFLHYDNWRRPFQGYAQSFFQRTLSGGLYFPLEDMFKSTFAHVQISNIARDILAGKCAGAINGLILNPLSIIKHKMWGNDSASFRATAVSIYKMNGFRPFFHGAKPTVLRDVAFGAVYTSMRHGLRRKYKNWKNAAMACDIFAAACATVASSPFNFARNIQYSYSQKDVPKMMDIWKRLAAATMSKPTVLEGLRYAQTRLGVGWGTARVALGIAFGAFVYETMTGTREERFEEQQ
eukprot:Plantae.Rhodophyta-Purpureofilum_apyrenoidigerum.ctg4155.p1 GENE.Plantae.Rhodophyta-Purpureofilum_apyrenoidigerum.ctg4155~~Plantae.Rhodophyta-Purpureofilum_apyrenoidigerum.ctg4155.p1  ORF type:complete len:289 (-),score=38.19 Plantae.Rhodophyta-Purpureofilum_apyrenoidigerum.ctg4155:564-1430(-)